MQNILSLSNHRQQNLQTSPTKCDEETRLEKSRKQRRRTYGSLNKPLKKLLQQERSFHVTFITAG